MFGEESNAPRYGNTARRLSPGGRAWPLSTWSTILIDVCDAGRAGPASLDVRSIRQPDVARVGGGVRRHPRRPRSLLRLRHGGSGWGFWRDAQAGGHRGVAGRLLLHDP